MTLDIDALHATWKAATPGEWAFDVEYVPDDHLESGVPEFWNWEIHRDGEVVLSGCEIEDPSDDLRAICDGHNAWPAIYERLRELEADAEQREQTAYDIGWADCRLWASGGEVMARADLSSRVRSQRPKATHRAAVAERARTEGE